MKNLRNPYEVLGIKEGSNQDEIKKAYREQVKKYHPDQYNDNPLKKLAEEKLREVNEAYDYLTKDNSFKNNNNSTWSNRNPGSNGQNSGSYGQNELFQRVRMNISSGNIGAAEEMLNRVSVQNAEWYYLKGLIFLQKGWYDEAYTHVQRAVNMEPNNFEYRSALKRFNAAGSQYKQTAYNKGYSRSPDLCTVCQCLWCSDCCCECMGGDLIGCC